MDEENGLNQSDSTSIAIKFTEIEKIGYKSKIRLHQFQIVSKQGFLTVTLTPNKQFADGELTKKWYDFIVAKGVKEFVPESYLEQAPTQYQIRYQQ